MAKIAPKRECPKCKGKGGYNTTLRDLSGRQPYGLGIEAYVPCDYPGCHNGIVDLDENRRITSGHIGRCTDCGACNPDKPFRNILERVIQCLEKEKKKNEG